jgi:hypothetical protein
MGVKIRSLCGCRVILARLFILGMMISMLGCGTSIMDKYRASLQDTGKPQYNWYNGKIQHDLLSGKYQRLEKDDWEDD